MSSHVHFASRRRGDLVTPSTSVGGGSFAGGRASPTIAYNPPSLTSSMVPRASPRHRYYDDDEEEEAGGSITSASLTADPADAADERQQRVAVTFQRPRVAAVLPPDLKERVCANTDQPSLGGSMVPRAPERRRGGGARRNGEDEDDTTGGSITSGPSVELGLGSFPPREVEALVEESNAAGSAIDAGEGGDPRRSSPPSSASGDRRRRQMMTSRDVIPESSTIPAMRAGNSSTKLARRKFREGTGGAEEGAIVARQTTTPEKIMIDEFTLEAIMEVVLHVPLPATIFAVATALRESESVAQLHRFSDLAEEVDVSGGGRRHRRGGRSTGQQIRGGSWTEWRETNAARKRDRSAAAARRRVYGRRRGKEHHSQSSGGIGDMTSLVSSFGKMELSWQRASGRRGGGSHSGDWRVRQLREALGELSRRPGSFATKVKTWDEARKVLSEILEFPPPEEEEELASSSGTGEASSTFIAAVDSSSPAKDHGGVVRRSRRIERKRKKKTILPDSVERYVQRIRRAMKASSGDGASSSQRSEFLTPSPSHERWRQVAMYTPRSVGVAEEEEEAEVPREEDDGAKLAKAEEGSKMMSYLEAEAEKRLVEVEAKEAELEELIEARMAAKEEEEREAAEAAAAEAAAAEERERASVLPPLTEEDRELLNRALYGIGPEDEIVGTAETDTVQRGSVQRLRPTKWLNDEVIHYFLTMLARRDAQLSEGRPGKRRCHFFKSFFMTKLLGEGGYRYANVKRWSKKVPGKDVFALDKIIFPINCGGVHWTCAVIFMQERRIQFYDSLLGSGMDYLKVLLAYLKDEHKSKKNAELDTSDWKLVDCQPDTPQQENGYDCGVFTCMFADYLSRDAPLTFNQDTVTECRQRIALSIVKGSALH